jgi:hypothetical protein
VLPGPRNGPLSPSSTPTAHLRTAESAGRGRRSLLDGTVTRTELERRARGMCQEHPTPPPPCAAAPVSGRKWFPCLCCFWGHCSHCCPCQGHQVPPQSREMLSLQDLAGPNSLETPGTWKGDPSNTPLSPLVYSFKHFQSWLFSDPRHSIAPHCRQEADSKMVISYASQSSPNPRALC